MKEITLRYTEALVRSAAKAFWLRVTGWKFFAALALLLCSLLVSIWTGDRSWWLGVNASFLGFFVLFTLAIYVVHYRAGISKFQRMGSPEAILAIDKASFRMTSNLGSTELPWSSITEIWQFPKFWLILFSRSQFVTFPLESIDAETREIVLSSAKSAGAKIS